jgi:glutamate synthase (NADPH/NADH) large chain
MAHQSLEDGTKVQGSFEIRNVHRAVGTMLSGEIAKRYGRDGLPEDTITFNFKGSAGQSFGAFGASGLTLMLEGDANDYVAKGLSGAKIILKTPECATYAQDENYIAGNTMLYGATSGRLFVNGHVGERFAIRNSGAEAVVEGVGDHGCEYMTGGTVVVLGKTGRNFAAGMSGGVAYVLDEDNALYSRCNMEMIEVEEITDSNDLNKLYSMIDEHLKLTNSKKAAKIISEWDKYSSKFKKVIPSAYKSIIEKMKHEKECIKVGA